MFVVLRPPLRDIGHLADIKSQSAIPHVPERDGAERENSTHYGQERIKSGQCGDRRKRGLRHHQCERSQRPVAQP